MQRRAFIIAGVVVGAAAVVALTYVGLNAAALFGPSVTVIDNESNAVTITCGDDVHTISPGQKYTLAIDTGGTDAMVCQASPTTFDDDSLCLEPPAFTSSDPVKYTALLLYGCG